MRDRIVAVLTDRPAGMSTSDIARALESERALTSSNLARLFNEGVVQRSKGGGRSAPMGLKERTWRLKP